MKSYGRAPTFLLLTGYEQVRSIAAELAGDHQAARDVQLVLPETGVCTTDVGGSSSCDVPATTDRSVRGVVVLRRPRPGRSARQPAPAARTEPDPA